MGDPETQPIIMRLKSDLLDAVRARARRAASSAPRWSGIAAPRSAWCSPPQGYPEAPRKGDVIEGLPDAEAHRLPGVPRRHAARGQARGRERRARAVRDRAGRFDPHGAAAAPTTRWRRSASTACSTATDIGARARRSASGVSASTDERQTSVATYLTGLQARIVAGARDARRRERFRSDAWQRPEGGGGVTRVIEDGAVFERGGRATSRTSCGPRTAALGERRAAGARRPRLRGDGRLAGAASAQSLLPHRAHERALSASPPREGEAPVWWFGGGMDLTPLLRLRGGRAALPRHLQATRWRPSAPSMYPRFKKWCDEYFFLKHRGEPRGIGGIFFDDFAERDFESLVRADAKRRRPLPRPPTRRSSSGAARHAYGERERDFQAYRRGRYVEFNLVYDRGTLFGLQSGGRTESILMSMPPRVAWRYDWNPRPARPRRPVPRLPAGARLARMTRRPGTIPVRPPSVTTIRSPRPASPARRCTTACCSTCAATACDCRTAARPCANTSCILAPCSWSRCTTMGG